MEGHDILNTFLRFRDQLSIVISTSMMMDALCVVNRTALLRITKCTRVKRHCSHRTVLLLLLLLLGSHRFLLICMDGGTFQAAAGGRIYSGDMLLHSAGLGTIKT